MEQTSKEVVDIMESIGQMDLYENSAQMDAMDRRVAYLLVRAPAGFQDVMEGLWNEWNSRKLAFMLRKPLNGYEYL